MGKKQLSQLYEIRGRIDRSVWCKTWTICSACHFKEGWHKVVSHCKQIHACSARSPRMGADPQKNNNTGETFVVFMDVVILLFLIYGSFFIKFIWWPFRVDFAPNSILFGYPLLVALCQIKLCFIPILLCPLTLQDLGEHDAPQIPSFTSNYFETTVFLWSTQVNNVELGQHLDGWPLKDTICCKF